MALRKIRLGDYIFQSNIKNDKLELNINNVRGISTQKMFIDTKANMDGVPLNNYKIVKPNQFAYVPDTSRRGDKISLAFNDTEESFLVSSISVVFSVNEKEINPKYLFMYFNRPEFDRYARYNSFGSAREPFDWEDMCDIDMELPDLPTQQKYVDVYLSMVENQKAYESGLEDLKLVCDGYIEDLRRNMPIEEIGNFIKKYDVKNTDGKITLEQGINIDKKFINPQRSNDNFYGRKVVRTGQIVYCTQLNNENVAVALRKGPDCIVSGVYDVIDIVDKNKLVPEYLMLWLVRKEFGRFVYWASQGTSYEFLSYENLTGYKIPVPSKDVQESIANVYKCYIERKEINERLKQQIKDICPILIKGSI